MSVNNKRKTENVNVVDLSLITTKLRWSFFGCQKLSQAEHMHGCVRVENVWIIAGISSLSAISSNSETVV